ncbi:MAG: DUF4339 domain-containing protein [Chlamydiales bacterium]
MGIMQLFNILICCLLISFLTSHLAKKRGKNPLSWFVLAFFLGIFALILLYILPSFPQKIKTSSPPEERRHNSDAWIKMWYYMDSSHQQMGPIEFPDLAKSWKEKMLSKNSLVWGEGMKEWQKLSDLPDILQELDHAH